MTKLEPKLILCPSLQDFFSNQPVAKTKKDPKRLSVERIYQKKTQLEHILLRPDSYIGSVEPVTQVRNQAFSDLLLWVNATVDVRLDYIRYLKLFYLPSS